MLKKLFFLSLLLIGGISFGQSAPTLYSVEYDTLCDGDYDEVFLTITIEDLDMDSTYISMGMSNSMIIDDQILPLSWDAPAYVPTETLRTFTVKGAASWGNPSGVNMGDITLEITGAIGVEGPPVAINLTDVPVYGEVMADLTTVSETYCATDFPLDLSALEVNSGGLFSWTDSLYNNVESNVFDPVDAYVTYVNDGGEYYIYYSYKNSAGCEGTNNFPVMFNDAPDITTNTNGSTCGSADGSIDANIMNGLAPYDVYWTTGFSEQVSSISTVSNLSSGVYYINVEDANGCKRTGKADVFDTDVMVSPTITSQYCAGQTGNVDLAVSAPGSITQVYWSNGQTTTSMDAPAGEYSVQIHTDNNCNFFGTYTIPDSSLKVKLDSYGDNMDCISTPSGYVNITTSGGDGTYAWDWQKNSTQVSTMENLTNVDGGLYSCTVSDGSGCSLTWDQTLGNYSNVFLWADEVVKSTCGNLDGEIDIFIDTFGDVPATYEWSTGSTSEDLTGVGSGTYTLTYTDQAGCENYLTVDVIDELPYQPTICLLTVDSSYTYNQVVWEKVPGEPIDAFNIYRETSNFGEFELVVSRDYALESFFMDNSASPVDRSWRYAITTVDACGNESNPSFIHKTIHTVSNTSNGTDYTISWDDYEGISYSDIDLWRHDNTNGWTNIGTYGIGTNSAPDVPPVTDGLDYYVQFNLTDGCQSTKATDYNSSRSNKADSAYNPGESTTSIEDEEYGIINIYPNPTSSIVNLYIEQYDMYERIELRDMNGRILNQKNISNQNEVIDLTEFANGVYFISIISGDESHQQKIIKR